MDLIISAVTHRTGSTLLQRIFNIRRQTLIWGEQLGCLTKSLEILNNFQYMLDVGGQEQADEYFNENIKGVNACIANMNPSRAAIKEGIIKSIHVLFATVYAEYREQHDMIGFKEVRYGEPELELFRECYPKAKIMLLIRNPISIWKSAMGTGWYTDEEGGIEAFADKWNSRAEYYFRLAYRDSNTYLVKYEDLIAQQSQTVDMITAIAQITKHELSEVLKIKILSTEKTISQSDEDYIRKHCKAMMSLYHYL